MEQHIPVNERSFQGQAGTMSEAGQLLRNLANTLRELINEARRRGMKPTIYSGENLTNYPFVTADEILSFGQVLFGRNVDRDVRVALQVLLSNTPYSRIRLLRRALQHTCVLVHNDEDVTESSIAAAAAFDGWLVSLQRCDEYPSGRLELDYSEADDELLPPSKRITIDHFNDVPTARGLRRRYVPNQKHHPNKFKGREWEPIREKGAHSPMPLDVDYEPMTQNKEQDLRNLHNDLPDSQAQRLLDQSIANGKQLYACMSGPSGKLYFFEFQPDNSGGYHGYIIAPETVPPELIQRLLNREK